MHRNSSTIDFIINDDNNAKSVFSQLTKFPFEDFIFDSSETKSKREMVNIGIVYCYNTIDVRTNYSNIRSTNAAETIGVSFNDEKRNILFLSN